MLYRRVEKTGWDVSALSFGCMRFKDADTAAEAVHKAVALGVTYFDVAPLYCGKHAEPWLGAAIKGLPRDKIIVTAKSSPGNGGTELSDYNPEAGFGIRTADEARRQIERSMEILGVDHLDMYQFWALHSEVIFQEGLKKGGFLEGVLAAHEEGLFDYIGMTTHSRGPEIVHFLKDSPYEFDMVTLPLHLIDPGRDEAIDYCASRGIGVVAMNPLGGGRLAKTAPLLRSLAAEVGFETLIEPALRYVAHRPGVTTALNGITYAAHAIEGTAAIDAGPLPAGVVKTLTERLGEVYQTIKPRNLCSACGYCGQCPMGIVIPSVLEAYTSMQIRSMSEAARQAIRHKLENGEQGLDPGVCSACGECEARCPNKIPVSELMAAAAETWPK